MEFLFGVGIGVALVIVGIISITRKGYFKISFLGDKVKQRQWTTASEDAHAVHKYVLKYGNINTLGDKPSREQLVDYANRLKTEYDSQEVPVKDDLSEYDITLLYSLRSEFKTTEFTIRRGDRLFVGNKMVKGFTVQERRIPFEDDLKAIISFLESGNYI